MSMECLSESGTMLQGSEPESLAAQMDIDAREIRRRLDYIGFTEKDRLSLQSLIGLVDRQSGYFADTFFEHLRMLDCSSALLNNPSLLAEARQLKMSHLKAMVYGEYTERYVDQHLRLGRLYWDAGLEPRAVMGAYHHMLRAIGLHVVKNLRDEDHTHFEAYNSLMKIAFFDIELIIDTLLHERTRTIHQQAEAIRKLSSPLLTLGKGLMILPLIGEIDPKRAANITDTLLHSIRRERIRAVVIDITGVPVVNRVVAHHFVYLVHTSKMMGATVVLSGLSAHVSRTLVELGVNLQDIQTYASLQDGVEALREITG